MTAAAAAQERVARIPIKATPPQREFMNSPAKYTLFQSGFGGGKSFIGRHKAVFRCIQNAGMEGMLIAATYNRLSRDVLPGFFEILQKAGIRYEWLKPAVPGTPSRQLLVGRGTINSIVHIASLDRGETVKGPNLAWINCEEVTLFPRNVTGKQETIWGVLVSRLRVEGGSNTIDASGTPEGMGNWTCDPGRWGKAPNDPTQLAAWLRDFKTIRASSWTNTHLPADFVQSMINAMDPTQVAEKVYGRPAAGTKGMAYYAFRVEKNVCPVHYDRLRGPIIVGLDFGVNPATCCLMQFCQGVITVFDEIGLADSNTPAMAQALKRRVRKLGVHPRDVMVYPDASGRIRHTVGGTDFAILREVGFQTLIYELEGNPRVRDRVNAMNGALYHRRVLVAPNCVGIVRDLSQVAIDDDGNLIKTPGLTHFSDGLGYAVEKLLPIRGSGSIGFI